MECCCSNIVSYLFSIHPRWKRQVADRLALAGYAVAYDDESEGLWQGPFPTGYRLEAENLVVTLADGQVELEARDTDTSVHYEVESLRQRYQYSLLGKTQQKL